MDTESIGQTTTRPCAQCVVRGRLRLEQMVSMTEPDQTHETYAPVHGAVEILYTNYRGEKAWRWIIPRHIWLGTTHWHTDEQWLLVAFDLDKNAERSFALRDIESWGREVD